MIIIIIIIIIIIKHKIYNNAKTRSKTFGQVQSLRMNIFHFAWWVARSGELNWTFLWVQPNEVDVMFNCLRAFKWQRCFVFNNFDELIRFKKEFRTEVDFIYHFIPIVYGLNFYWIRTKRFINFFRNIK